jgi:iron complex transport system substrate-binding protein
MSLPRSRAPFRRALALVALLVAVAAACGETDDPTASSPTTAASSATSTTLASGATTTTAPAPTWPLTAPAPKLPATVTDSTGTAVTVTSIDRIASLQGDITEILWTLGLGDRIAVVDSTAVYPTTMASKPNAGFFRTLSAEGLLAAKPTVALVHPGAGPPPVIAALKAAGIPVVVIPEYNGTDLGDTAKKIKAVGEAVGLAEHAAALAAQVDKEIADAQTYAKNKAKGSPVTAYVVPRGQQVFLTGLDNPSNVIIAAAGGTPVAKLLNLPTAAPLTPEAMIGVQPAVVISTFTGVAAAGGEAAFLALKGIAETPAGKDKRLVLFDDTFIQQYGPRTGQAIRLVADKLHA